MHSQAIDRYHLAHTSSIRFVHYTSAEVAFKIIQYGKIWMRNAIATNDYSEVQHGEACLRFAWKSDAGKKMAALLNELYPGMSNDVVRKHDSTFDIVRTNTYITCVSEHNTSEDITGRLSMWRAYGATNGVALVINQTAMMSTVDDLKAYSSPVEYYSAQQAVAHISNVTEKIAQEKEAFRACGYDSVLNTVLQAFRFAVVSTKHPSFAEEQEWRIVYMPNIGSSPKIEKSFETVVGIPQIVYKLPIRDLSKVERIIIGPTKYPKTISDAFIDLLTEAGVTDPAARVVVSNLPLRQ